MTEQQETFLRRLTTATFSTKSVALPAYIDELERARLVRALWDSDKQAWNVWIELAGRTAIESIDARREAERKEKELRAVLERERDEALKRDKASRRWSTWIAIIGFAATVAASLGAPIVSWMLDRMWPSSRKHECPCQNNDRGAPAPNRSGREPRETEQEIVEKAEAVDDPIEIIEKVVGDVAVGPMKSGELGERGEQSAQDDKDRAQE